MMYCFVCNVRSNVRSNAIPNVIFNVRFNVRFNARFNVILYLKFKLSNQNIVFLPRNEVISPGISLLK